MGSTIAPARQHNRCATLMFVAPEAVSGINCHSVGSCNIRRKLWNASSSNPHSAATTIGNVLAKPHPGTPPNCNSRFAWRLSHFGEPSRSGVVVSAARERARCGLPAVVLLVMSAPCQSFPAVLRIHFSICRCWLRASLCISWLVGRGCGALQVLQPRGRTWHNCKLSDLSDAWHRPTAKDDPGARGVLDVRCHATCLALHVR